jgi:hypothetical protein
MATDRQQAAFHSIPPAVTPSAPPAVTHSAPPAVTHSAPPAVTSSTGRAGTPADVAVPSTRRAGAIGLVLGALLSGPFGSAVGALLLPRVGVDGVVTMRLTIAALVLLAVCRPRVRGYRRADWLLIGGFGAALAGMNTLAYHAIALIPLGPVVMLEVLGPLVLSMVTARRAHAHHDLRHPDEPGTRRRRDRRLCRPAPTAHPRRRAGHRAGHRGQRRRRADAATPAHVWASAARFGGGRRGWVISPERSFRGMSGAHSEPLR